MSDGSRWWIPLYEGVIAPKHIENLGPAIWLYLYILKYAKLHDGELMYSHVEAAQEMDTPRGTIRRWFYTLQENGYITNQGQTRNRIKVRVSNWRPIEEFDSPVGRSNRSARAAAENAETARVTTNEHPEPGDGSRVPTRVFTRVFTDEHPLYIRITQRLRDLDIPFSSENGADGTGFGPVDGLENLFSALHRWIVSSSNPNSALREFFRLCYPHREPPDYGRIGVEVNRIGGDPGRLADLIWQSLPRPPTGDVLSYVVQAELAKKKRSRGSQKRKNTNGPDAGPATGRYGGTSISPSDG